MASSSAALMISRVLQTLVMMVSLGLLARMLTPADFGIAALAMIFPEIVMTFHQFGMSTALIRQDQLSRFVIRRCTAALAWRNLACSVALVGVSLPLAWSYGSWDILWCGFLIAPFLFVGGVTGVHRGLLEREMRFSLIAWAQVAASAVGSVVAILAAIRLQSPVPLVLQSAIDLAVRAGAFAWFGARLARALPERSGTDAAALTELARFGRELTLAKIVRHAVGRLDQIVVGYISNAATLGLYSAARRWSFYPSQEIHLSTLHPAVAFLSRSDRDVARFRADVRISNAVPGFLALCTSTLLFLEAPAVIGLVFGDQWLGVVPLFRILLIAAAFRLPVFLSNQVFYAEGRTNEQLRWTSIEAVVYGTAILLAAFGDEYSVAIAYTVAAILVMMPGMAYAALRSRANVSDFFVPWAAVMAIMVVSGSVAWLMKTHVVVLQNELARAVVSGAVFSVVAVALAGAVWLVLPLRVALLRTPTLASGGTSPAAATAPGQPGDHGAPGPEPSERSYK